MEPLAILIAAVVAVVIYSTVKGLQMNEALQEAITNLNEEVTESNGKLESIKTYLEGLPDVVAAAVQQALEAADADATLAAEQVNAARETISNSVDSTLAAIEANPDPEPTPDA